MEFEIRHRVLQMIKTRTFPWIKLNRDEWFVNFRRQVHQVLGGYGLSKAVARFVSRVFAIG